MKQYDVYGIGNALVDTEIHTDENFLQEAGIEKGLMTLVDLARQNKVMTMLEGQKIAAKRASGGSAANTLIAVSQLGGSAYYSCKVADDEMGSFYLNDLHAAGVYSAEEKAQGNEVTGKCLVMITPDAERTMNTYLGISETLSLENVNFDALTQSKWLYMEGYLATSDSARTAVIACKDAAEKAGVKTAITLSDPGMVQFFKAGLQEMIGDGVDLLFCNEEEALSWTGKPTAQSALTELAALAKQVVITLGNKGALIFDGQKTLSTPAVTTEAIDTNGAGDAYAGGFLYAINHGFDFETSGKIATATASKVVAQYGPRLSKSDYKQISSSYK